MLTTHQKQIILTVAILPFCLALVAWFLSRVFEQTFENPFQSNQKPHVMLWAWETSGDLRWVDPSRFGIAYLAETITLYDDRIWAKPRMRPLKVPPGTFLTSVVRLERSRERAPTLSQRQLDQVVTQIVQRAEVPGVRGLQVDFDARRSEREFYRSLLMRLRRELPSEVELSMTALASWCIGDRWLDGTSADEIVPMFFSMGADNQRVLQHLRAGRPVHNFARQKAIGLAENSTDVIDALARENGLDTLKGRRLYLFSPHGWTEASVQRLLRRVGTI